ncbi:MAG: 3-isopropylmalate dehydratase large subunit [Oligoflexus sp.]
MGQNLYQKIWKDHIISKQSENVHQVFVDLHLIHEVTSPQAFSVLKEKNLKVAIPERTVATVDHIIPTKNLQELEQDAAAKEMVDQLYQNATEHGIRILKPGQGHQGIVHVIGPELGLTQPGMIIVCGDSHTSTHGAFGALAFGIGTSQVRDVLASQTILLPPSKVRRIWFDHQLPHGASAKDLALYLIHQLGVDAGIGYAYEYAGPAISALSMDERMTLCNMSIEAGARCGYINPDQATVQYLKERTAIQSEEAFLQIAERWLAYASDSDASYDDEVVFDARDVKPRLSWGINPEQNIAFDESIPDSSHVPEHKRHAYEEGLNYMKFEAGQRIKGTAIDVAFIGSCTNGRFSDFAAVAEKIKGKRVHPRVRALAVPGSEEVDRMAREQGIDQIFRDAGFEWRKPGCSMCIAMNQDRLQGSEICASSSNRNFKGRQGSPQGRTLLMSPLSVASCAIAGEIIDPQEVFV